MSSWAPHLLRLHQYGQQKIFLTYARNAVIGRFSTYPGYYATGFTRYHPVERISHHTGPDVEFESTTTIYTPHMAFTLDYLYFKRSHHAVEW